MDPKIVEKLEIVHDQQNEKSKKDKIVTILKIVLKIVLLLFCLYSFIVSLDLMSSAFRLIGGKYATEAFKSNVILSNPVAGLVIGVIVTVVVQSSSTSTSIIVSMVSSGILKVKVAIPIIMGANIGTSVTSTLVSLTQLTDKENFRRAFAGATVHDSFNLLSVLVLLPIEVVSGYLEKTTGWLVKLILSADTSSAKNPEILTVITKPLTNAIIQLDKKVLEDIAQSQAKANATLIKHFCSKKIKINLNGTIETETIVEKCKFLLEPLEWPEWAVGLLLLVVSLVILCTCLIAMVKILSSIFKGPVAKVIQKVVNSDWPGIWKYFTGPVAILLGCGLTILVQSSSVFTSSLIPLCGMGIVSLERLFPLTLGSNLGTTITGILASLSSSSTTLKDSIQIALCHSLFNITGILVWYPIPFMRKVPIKMAQFLGDQSADHKWFAIMYLILSFIVIPGFIFAISLLGLAAFLAIMLFLINMRLVILILVLYQFKLDICQSRDLIESSTALSPFNHLNDNFLHKRADRSRKNKKSHKSRKRYPEKGRKKHHEGDDQKAINYRLGEAEKFYKKIKITLKKIAKKENITNVNEVFDKIKNHTGNGFYAIVFNCSSPSVVDIHSKISPLPDSQVKTLKTEDKCNKNDNLWRFNGQDGFVSTFDNQKKTLSENVLPFETLYPIFNQLELCRDFLIFIRHPVYFTKMYKKPAECLNKDPATHSK
ncbi:Sodium-dependent phosphate transport 2B [Brachionus plicatilis]|uniref:Sodium-dependent phosphate transport 2B n=1 Tax=Brachionus plicatilis TaxID=10195 RepID=A0A3M7RI54_BRAPC|nr:Sodium-dependent phosphate transport 2B [Brachionus plicatilis]